MQECMPVPALWQPGTNLHPDAAKGRHHPRLSWTSSWCSSRRKGLRWWRGSGSFTTLPCALPLLSKTACQGDPGADRPTSAYLTSTQQNSSSCSRECGRSWLESTIPQKGSGRLLPRRSSPPPSASGTSDVTSGFGLATNTSKKGNKRTPC
jgi:hypothetical protein